jgi:O-antigen/teichoic acid export membrane protein
MASKLVSSRLARDLLLRGCSDVFNAAVNLLVIALVARQLNAGGYGIYTQVITTASLLLPVLLLRLNTACVRFFPALADNSHARGEQFTTVLVIVLLTALGAAVLINLLPDTTGLLIFGEAVPAQLVLLLGCYLLLRCLVSLCIDYFRALNQPALASGWNSLRFLLVLIAVGYAIFKDSAVQGILLAQLGAESLTLLLLLRHLFTASALQLPFQWQGRAIRPWLIYSLPLVPYSFFLAVNQFADRYFITHMVSLDAAGVYSFSYNLVAASFLLNASISYVIYPHLCRLWESGDMPAVEAQLLLAQRLFVWLAVPIAIGFCLVYAPVVTLMTGAEFVIGMGAVLAIVAGQFLLGLCSIFGYLIDLTKRTTVYVRILFATASLNLILNALLVPSQGIAGAALATALTYALQLLLMRWATRGMVSFKPRLDVVFMGLCACGGLLMLFGLQLLPPMQGIGDILLLVAAGALLYCLFSSLVLRNYLSAAWTLLQHH